jgi:hypothetical protein
MARSGSIWMGAIASKFIFTENERFYPAPGRGIRKKQRSPFYLFTPYPAGNSLLPQGSILPVMLE